MMLRFLVFFAVLLTLLGLINAYIHRRVSRAFALERAGRRRLAAVLIGGLIAMVLARFVGPLGRTAVLVMGGIGATVQVGALVAFAILAVDGLVRGVGRLAQRVRGTAAEPGSEADRDVADRTAEQAEHRAAEQAEHRAEDQAADLAAVERAEDRAEDRAAGARTLASGRMTRRSYLERATAAGALAFGGGSALYGTVFGRTDYSIEEVPLRIEKLPSSLDGFTMTQLSDLHIGLFVAEPEMASAIALVKQTHPDIIVLTGDLLDNDAAFAPMLARFVRQLGEIAPVYAIPGNHDHYAGVRDMVEHLRQGGAHVLFNSHERVGEGRIVLAGVDDVWARRKGRGPDLKRALYGTHPDQPRVLLCHNPVFFPEACHDVDVQLSGHTHGGQFNPGVRPADAVLPFGYVAGRYTRDQAQLYVNRGFGTTGPPARLGSAPEITKLVLTT